MGCLTCCLRVCPARQRDSDVYLSAAGGPSLLQPHPFTLDSELFGVSIDPELVRRLMRAYNPLVGLV